jgi:16S rRNA (adenine1518-N6/adenine1519-N6)-dimethyltransferase
MTARRGRGTAARDATPVDSGRTVAVHARRALGQHFLLDLNLCRRIVRAAGPLEQCQAIEIGPGPGTLTRALLESDAACVTAVEKDARFIPDLEVLAATSAGRLRVIHGDALAFDPVAGVEAPRKLIANLPYNVAAPLLVRWVAVAGAFERLIVMVQKEMADRMAASPGTREYGRLSVILQWRFRVRSLFNVDPRAFVPPPKVTSTVCELIPLAAPLEADMALLERVTQAAFGQRRKMLRSSLKSLGIDPRDAGIDETARAEQLDVDQFCALAHLLRDAGGR